MFPDTDLDEYGFNVVHQQVLGLNGLDLKEILSECSTKTLNEGDLVYNRTALFWSARRGDMDAVETLISSGADTNKADYESVTPLSHSVNCIQPSNLSTFGLLLQHGADVHTANVYGWTTLHRLATFNPSTRGFSSSNFTALKLLVHSGINVNAQNWRGVTPLMHTIEFKNFQMTTKLIHLGADVHLKDCNRHNALCSAVVFHEHPLIQLLLECGADHIGKIDGAEGSLLHVAAEYADIKSLQVLTSGRLATRGIHYKRREDGLTPIEVARARTDVSPEWIDACQEFFWSVDETRNAPRGHNQPETYGFGSRFSCGDDNDDDDVDIFVDALEE
ncbi:hypothetical protein MMC20_007848 [Loxospora ochrophaea]|nr:hypothetical protein [Loxospora ochrophaea]